MTSKILSYAAHNVFDSFFHTSNNFTPYQVITWHDPFMYSANMYKSLSKKLNYFTLYPEDN